MQPFVSIIITNFNKKSFLSNCIKSCYSQNYQKFEVILIDNDSNDGSIEIIKKFKKIRLVKSKRNYSSPALNQLNSVFKGLNISKGTIICLLDSDDYFKKGKLISIVNYFKNNKNEKLVCDIPIKKYGKKTTIFKFKKNKELAKIWPTTFPTSSISFKKDYFDIIKKNLYEGKFDKLEIDFRLCSLTNIFFKKLPILDKNLTIYRQDTGGIMSKYKKYHLLWWLKRKQAHDFFGLILSKKKINRLKSLDYSITMMVFYLNSLINSLFTRNKKSNI